MHITELLVPEQHTEPGWVDYQRLTTELNREIVGGPQWDTDPEAALIDARAKKDWAVRRLLAYDGDLAVGSAHVQRNLLDDPSFGYLFIYVSPSHRRLGIARALAERLRRACAEDGVTKVQAWITTGVVEEPLRPRSGFGGVDPEHPGVQMALAQGFTLRQVERVSRYDFARPLVDPAEALAEARAVAGDEYEVITLDGLLPDDLLAGYGALLERMTLDVPRGDLTVVEQKWSAERVRETEERILLTNHLYRAVVRHLPSGDLVALSELVREKANPVAFVDQWDTIVLGAHRGRRLGTLVKAANLIQVREKEPDAEAILTWNAEENAQMLNINEKLGYYPVLYEGAFEA